MAAPSDALPPLRGRALLDWALQPLLGSDDAAVAAAQDAASWGRVARVLRADSAAGAGLPPGAWRAVCAACSAPPAAGDALPSSVLSVLVEARRRRVSGLNARLEAPDAVAAAAAQALRRASARGTSAAWRALASETLSALQHAAQAAPNARKTCALFVESVLPEFAAAWYALRAGAAPEDTELAQTVEATLHAGLFHGSLANGHLAAAASAAAAAALSTPHVTDVEQPARKRLKTAQQQASAAAPAPSASPQAALYQLVCARLQSGDSCFVALLPWLTRCFGAMQRPHGPARDALPSGAASKQHGFAVVQLFGSALADVMQGASKRDNLGAWAAAAEAWSGVLLEAHRHDMCRAPGRAVSGFLVSSLPALLQQQVRFPSAHAAAAAGGVLRALLEIDVHLLEDRLSEVWSVLMRGAAHAPGVCACAARDLIIAYGETRLLPKVLVAATTALCGVHPPAVPECGALLCAPELGAAWSKAAEKLPAMQFPELLLCVRDCLAQADCAGVFSQHSGLACVASPLAEMLSATVAGIGATPEASAALAAAAIEVQAFVKSLLDKVLPLKSTKLASDGAVALCLRVCTCIASLAHACAACTSDIAVPPLVPEQCDAVLCDCLERLAPWLAKKRNSAPWCELEASRAALLLRTWEDRSGTATRVHVAHLVGLVGGPGFVDAAKGCVWDGVFSTVTLETLPCALWQLATEHMATWCTSVPLGCLEEGMACLTRTATAPAHSLRQGITATACSRQLLSDASFYELPTVRAVLPRVFVTELRRAQDSLKASVKKGGLFDGLHARVQAADVQPCIAAAHALVAAEPAAARAGDAANTAASDAISVVRLLSWIPAEYFSSLPELPELLDALCRLEKMLIAAALCSAAGRGAEACHAVSTLRQVVANLLAVSASSATVWTDEVQVHWLVRSLDVLVVLAGNPVGNVQPDCDLPSESVALSTGALLVQLSSDAASGVPVSLVLGAVATSCSDLRDLAACFVSDSAPADTPTAFLPRTVQLQQRQPKSHVAAPVGLRELAAPPLTEARTSHALAMSKATVAASVLTAVVGARPADEWLVLQRIVADALDSLCASAQSAQSVELCRPLFKALAATLELEAGAGNELRQKALLSTDQVIRLLHAAAQLLSRGSVGAVELLRYLQASVKVLLQRNALPDGLCRTLLALYTAVLRARVANAVARGAAAGDVDGIRSAALDAFAALAATAGEQQQALLVDALVAAAQDVPVANGEEASVQWATLAATLQLLTVLLRAFPKASCVSNSERCLAAAMLACAHAGHATATPLALLEQASLPAVSVLDALLKSRSRFPLRGSSVACALAVPATLFDASSQLAAMSGPGSRATFTACCSLLATATRCRPHELQRCMPLLSSSSRALAGALLRAVQALDDSCGSPVPATLLTCAADLGALYSVVAAEDTVHGKYCAHMLADYVTAAAAAHLDACSHAAAAPLEDGVHALLGACTSFELQQLHVTLGAGLGGVRQTMLAQLTEQRERVKYSGKV